MYMYMISLCISALQTCEVLDLPSLESLRASGTDSAVFPEYSHASSPLLVLEFKYLLTEG